MRPFSRLLTTTAGRRASQPTLFRATATPRTFGTTRQLRLKETKEQDPQEVEKAKQQQGQSTKAREELESQSESNVQADREKVHDHDSHIEDLQKETAQKHQKDHPEGK